MFALKFGSSTLPVTKTRDQDLINANGLVDPNRLSIGQELIVPK